MFIYLVNQSRNLNLLLGVANSKYFFVSYTLITDGDKIREKEQLFDLVLRLSTNYLNDSFKLQVCDSHFKCLCHAYSTWKKLSLNTE